MTRARFTKEKPRQGGAEDGELTGSRRELSKPIMALLRKNPLGA